MKVVIVVQIAVFINVQPVQYTVIVVIDIFPVRETVTVPIVVSCV